MTPEAWKLHEAIMEKAGLSAHTPLVIARNGRVRHVSTSGSALAGRRALTWCNMFWRHEFLRLADRDEDATLPLCASCLRTLEAAEARWPS